MKRYITSLMLSLAVITAAAQKVEFKKAFFRTGDDPAWSSVSADESGWSLVSIEGGTQAKGIREENSYAWYRIHFTMKVDRKSILYLHLGYIDDVSEVFLNGSAVGSSPAYNQPCILRVTGADLNPGGENVLAIRVRNNGGQGGIGEERDDWFPNGKYIEQVADEAGYVGRLISDISEWSRSSKKDISNTAHYSRYASGNEVLGQPRDGEHRVVLMGDSITDGWPGARPSFFADNGIIGRGISGEVSAQFLLRFQNDVIELKPTLVVINYGTNDIAENLGPYSEEQTFLNVKAMCEMAAGSGIKVVLASTLPHGGFLWNPSVKDVMQKVRSLNARVKAYAEQNGIVWVDYFSAMVSEDGTRMREDLSKDGVHPNAEGYAIMESLILPVISELR